MTEASPALRELLEQHAALHVMIEECEQLADDIDRGRGDLEALVGEVARLRTAFEAHTRSEEQLLGSILRDLTTFGGVRIDHLCADHVEEHRALVRHLSGPTAELRATLDELRVHLAVEERYFQSARVLRGDARDSRRHATNNTVVNDAPTATAPTKR